MKPYWIWWLSYHDTELIGEELDPEMMPEWLCSLYASRYGIWNGRGRLWEPGFVMGLELAVDPWPTTDLSEYLRADYGGLVIRAEDLPLVCRYPGVITDFALRPLWEFEMKEPRE